MIQNTYKNVQKYTISEKLKNIYLEMNISPDNILQEYALSKIYAKIDKYKAEISLFEKKYDCSYSDFKAKLKKMKNEEVFQWDDDVNDWQFAHENIIYWQDKLAEMKNND
jgi:hypothetical protein